jgi:hypothetical protein
VEGKNPSPKVFLPPIKGRGEVASLKINALAPPLAAARGEVDSFKINDLAPSPPPRRECAKKAFFGEADSFDTSTT